MIVTTVLHGRTRRDGRNLIRHLTKPENQFAYIAEIGNSVAETLPELIAVMEIYRDASASLSSFHHLTINPATDLAHAQVVCAANMARLELDPSDVRPYGIVLHGKPRAEPRGGSTHGHLLLGHVDSTGKALDDGWSKLRTERVSREIEFALGEPPVLGRHHRAVLKALRNRSPEVADWLERAFGANPPLPRSAFAPGARGRARKNQLDLPKAKAVARAVWEQCEDKAEFRTRLAEAGLELVPGEHADVWIIQDRKSRLVGAADRLLRVPRQEFELVIRATFGRDDEPSSAPSIK